MCIFFLKKNSKVQSAAKKTPASNYNVLEGNLKSHKKKPCTQAKKKNGKWQNHSSRECIAKIVKELLNSIILNYLCCPKRTFWRRSRTSTAIPNWKSTRLFLTSILENVQINKRRDLNFCRICRRCIPWHFCIQKYVKISNHNQIKVRLGGPL